VSDQWSYDRVKRVGHDGVRWHFVMRIFYDERVPYDELPYELYFRNDDRTELGLLRTWGNVEGAPSEVAPRAELEERVLGTVRDRILTPENTWSRRPWAASARSSIGPTPGLGPWMTACRGRATDPTARGGPWSGVNQRLFALPAKLAIELAAASSPPACRRRS
jgi:hypothetical protein